MHQLAQRSLSRLMLASWLALVSTLAACNTREPASPPPLPTQVMPTSTHFIEPSATAPATATPTPPEPTPEPTQPLKIIRPQNVDQLAQTAAIRESGAQLFAWTMNGHSVALGDENSINVYDIHPPQLESSVNGTPIFMETAPDGKTLAWADTDNLIHLVDLPSMQETMVFNDNTGAVTSLAFSPQGNLLASAAFNNRVLIWDIETGKLQQDWELSYWLDNLSFSPGGRLLAGADLPAFKEHMLEVASGEEVNTLSWQQEAIPALSGAFLSPDWKYLAWVARSTVQLMDVETGELGVTLEHEDYVNADVSWSPDGTLLASAAAGTVNGQFSNAIYIWDVNNTNPLNTLVVDNPIVEVAFSTDRVELASLTSNGALQIWTIP